MKTLVEIILGSDSDLPVMQESAKILEAFGVSYEITIASAHRTPDRLVRLVKSVGARGINVIIAGAGGSAHLPGVIASYTHLPVIGVPITTKTFGGLDSLLSIVQMPPGIPVATVAVNGAKNAGLLAIKILALHHKELQEKLFTYSQTLKHSVDVKAQKLEMSGYKKYLKSVS